MGSATTAVRSTLMASRKSLKARVFTFLERDGVDDPHLAINQLGEQGVAVGLAAHLLGHVQAVVLAGPLLGVPVAAALEQVGLAVAVAGVARALLAVELAGRALDLAAVLRPGRALAGVGVVADERLLDEGRVDLAAEGFSSMVSLPTCEPCML
jgi:hypothetical protein